MSKPIRDVEITTVSGSHSQVSAVFDTGSFHTLVREDRLPPDAMIIHLPKPRMMGTAAKGGTLEAIGFVHLQIRIDDREIEGEVLVAPILNQEFLIGAGMMQLWDISIANSNGATKITVGHDMHEPNIQTVE